MIPADVVDVSITYGTKITFFLRMIGIAEENQLRQSAFGLTDDEKTEKEYSVSVKILQDLSVKMPSGLFPDAPKKRADDDTTVYIDDFSNPVDAIEAFFAERSIVKERIAFYAIRGYFVRLQPSESFL